MTRVAAVILAAGASSRLGQPKQLVRLGGELLLARAVRIASKAGCDPVVVVLGARAEEILEACPLTGVEVIINSAWEEGMAASIRMGIAAVADRVEAAVVMTCDQPAASSDHLRRLIEQSVCGLVASAYDGRRGVPACFPAAYFSELAKLQGDAGARELLRSARAIALAGGELDVDTPAALATAREMYPRG